MKRLILTASIVMLSLGAYAQHEVGSVTFQPKVGMNISTFTKDDYADPRVGLVLGMDFEYQLNQRLGLSAGLLYSMQGAEGRASIGNYAPLAMTLETDYVIFPIMANVYVVKGLALKIGIQPGINVVADYTVSSKNGSSYGGSLKDADMDVNTFYLDIPIGLSYEFSKIVIDARYNLGLTRIASYDISKHSVFQFTLGYKIPL